ncbi:MAG: tetratricopeptide repeat protein [Flavobacteriaceae bacterium]|nr:tetratricopeptide repeat protein [Flavobacteriaceae bacterium]
MRIFILCGLMILTPLIKVYAIINNVKGETLKVSPLTFTIQQEKNNIFKRDLEKAKTLFRKKEYSKSLEISLILIEKAKKYEDKELEYLCSFLIGDIFIKLNNHKKALLYFKKSLNILQSNQLINLKESSYVESFSSQRLTASNYLRIGAEYYRLGKRDSALQFYNKIIKMPTFDNRIESLKASAYTNLSGIYTQDSVFDLARDYAIKAINIHKRNNDKVSESAALINLANIHLGEKNYIKAKETYIDALALIENNKTNSGVKYKEQVYYNLAWTLYLLKDYTAYDYQEKSYLIKDSLRNAEINHIINEIYEKYNLRLAKEKTEKAKAEEQRKAWFFGVLSLLVLISSGVILYNYKLRQRNLKLKIKQNELDQKSKIDKLKSESQTRILNATLDGKETERKQIAETLHDSVSSLLSSANLHLQATKMQFNGTTPIEIDKTQKIIVEASQKIRDLSHTLVSSVLLKFGLAFAIKDMADKYSNSKIEIETDIKGVKRYQQNFEIKVYNIIQELVNNILKHSNAKKALVKVHQKKDRLLIAIQDDGDGFDKSTIANKDGLGINQIEARIQMMKGKFEINSNSKTGTIIEIELPIVEKETKVNA